MIDPALILLLFVIILCIYKSRKKHRLKLEDRYIASYQSSGRIKRPKKHNIDGEIKTPEELDRDLARYLVALSNRGKTYSKVEKMRQQRIGVTHYIWRSADDGDSCPDCEKNNGKMFSWKMPPTTGHPGEGKCCLHEICRCYPEAIIK